MTQNKTLPQAIAGWFTFYSYKKERHGETALEKDAEAIIREQERRIELLREAARLAKHLIFMLENNCVNVDIARDDKRFIDSTLAATSQDAEWKV